MPLKERSTVKEKRDLELYASQIKDAVFGKRVLFIPWQLSLEDTGYFKPKRPDGLLWLPSKDPELWLVELEWKYDTNFFDQLQTFQEANVNKDKLQCVLKDSLKNSEGHDISAGDIEAYVSLTMRDFYSDEDGVLQPKLWVVLGHEKNNIDYLEKLRKKYTKKTNNFFRETGWLVTTVRWFSGEEKNFFLLDNYYSNKSHDALLVPIYTTGRESVRVSNEASPVDEQNPEESKADKVWAWLKNTYRGLERENLRLRIQPGFNRYHDFEIAWEKGGIYLWVFDDNYVKRPKTAVRRVFPDLDVPDSVAEKWGEYVDVSDTLPSPLGDFGDVDRMIREESEGLYHESRKPRPYAEFFDNEETGSEIKKNHRLWKALMRGILDTKQLVELTGIKGQGRSAKLDHILTGYSICERKGDEFRLTDEAAPYVQRMLANADKMD